MSATSKQWSNLEQRQKWQYLDQESRKDRIIAFIKHQLPQHYTEFYYKEQKNEPISLHKMCLSSVIFFLLNNKSSKLWAFLSEHKEYSSITLRRNPRHFLTSNHYRVFCVIRGSRHQFQNVCDAKALYSKPNPQRRTPPLPPPLYDIYFFHAICKSLGKVM